MTPVDNSYGLRRKTMPSRLYVSLLVVAAIATDSWEHRAWAAPLAEGQGSLAHLEIHAPVGAEVKVEGRNLGKMTAPTRDVEYKSLEAGKEYPIVIEAAFDGKATQRKVVSLMRGQTVRVVFLHPDARRPELVVQTGHSECITSMAFSPDGSQVLTGSQDNSVILWDAASGQQLRTFSIKGPKSVAFSADGQQVLVPGEDATRLWNRVTGEQAEWFNDSFNFAAITPDGRYLGWGGYSQAGVWDLVTAKKLQAIETEKLAKGLSVNCGAWNRRGTLLALGGGDFDKPHTIVVWDPFSKRTVMELPNKFRRLAAVAFSLDDSLIITASGEYREPGQVAIWDAQSGEHLRDFSDVPSQPKSLEFSADGTRLLTVASNAAIIWDFESGKQLVKFARKMDEEYFSVECAAFSPDGKRIATGGNPNQAMIWDSTTGKRLQTLRGRSPKNGAVAVSPDGQFIAVAAGSSICLWEAASGSVARVLNGHWSNVTSVAFSPDSRWLASGSWDKSAKIWDVQSGALLATAGNPASVGAAFINGGKEFVLAGQSGIDICDTKTRRLVRSIPLEAKWYSLAAHAGDRHVLVRSPGGSSKASEFVLLDCDLGRAVRTIKSEGCSFGRGCFDPLRNRVIAEVTRERDCADKEATASKQCQVVAWEADSTNRVVFEAADGEEITGLTLSADGEKLAACVRNPEQTGRICVWSGDTFEVQLTLENDHGFISDLLISPNGTRLAASFGKYNEAGKVVIWELNDAKKELQLPGRLGHVWRMAFTSDGERLITAGGEIDRAELFEWDLAAGRQVRSLQGHKHAVTHLAASQDGLCLLICDIGTSILWDLSTGSKLRIWKGHSGSVKAVNFSPDGKRLLTAGGRHDGELFLWDVPDGELAAEYAGAAMPYSHAAFSHDGSRIVAGAGQKRGPDITLKDGSATRTRSSYLGDTIFVWDVQSRRLSKSWKRDDDQALCFNRAGDKIVTRKGCLIDAETGALAVSPTRHDTFIQQPAISSDGRWIVTPDQRGQVILWDANVGRSVRSFGEHTGKSTDQWVYGVAISPDNRRVATASRNGTAVIWALATGARLATLRGHKGEVTAVAFSPDGKRLATGGFDSQIILWDADTGRRLGNLPGGTWNVRSLAFSPSSRRLISAHGNNIGYIIDVASRKQLVSLPGNKKRMGCVAYSPDGKWVYTGGDGGAGILWDAQALRGVHTLSPEGFAWSAVFSRDSRTLFVGGNELVRAFDVATGREKTRISFTGSVHGIAAATSADRFIAADNDDVTVFEQSTMRRVTAMRSIGSDGWLSASCLSADGDRVLYGNSNGRLMLCETETGNDIQSFHGHAALVNGMAFMPDGRRVVSASSDGSSAVWDASTGDMLLRMIVLDDGREWLAVTPEGLFDGSPGGRASVKVRASGGLDLEPIDRFFQDFYHPGLLAEIAHGERPMPQGDFASRMAPLVKIMSPRQGSAIVDARVTIEAEVTDRGGGIKGPWIVQNGARVLAEGERTVTGGRVRQTFVLSLVEGENRLEVRAASGDGSWESEPASLLLNYEQPLAEPAVYLVAVGINKYAEESLNLRFAAPDARDLAGVFQARGPSLYGAERTHVTPLVDEQATQQGIREALGQLAKVANPQDTVVVFLAGHGATIGQRYYFITQEFKQEEEHFEDDVRKQGFAADEFGDLLGKTRALKRVLIFDTCQSGGALAVHQTARDPFAFRGALERLSHSQGVFTIAAAAANDQAQEAQQLKHGLLTYALLAGLGAVDEGPLAGQQLKPAGDANVAEVREWFSFAQDKVPLLTKLYFGQEQFVGFSGQGASFPVLPLKDKSESVR